MVTAASKQNHGAEPDSRKLGHWPRKKISSRTSVPAAARVVGLREHPFSSVRGSHWTMSAKPAPELKGGFSRLGSATPQPHNNHTQHRSTRKGGTAAVVSLGMSNGRWWVCGTHLRHGDDVCCLFHLNVFLFWNPSGTCQRLDSISNEPPTQELHFTQQRAVNALWLRFALELVQFPKVAKRI